jgi:hypothetical protein
MRVRSQPSSVGRRALLSSIPFAFLADTVLAQSATADGCPPAVLTPAQFGRMYNRLLGKWQLIAAKSTFLAGTPPRNPTGFIYSPAPDGAVAFTNENGTSVQKYDGTVYDASPTIPGTMLARVLHDEFTVENVLSRNGRITARNLQYYAPDGRLAIYVQRDVNEAGDKTPRAFMVYEKVPDSTKLWWQK